MALPLLGRRDIGEIALFALSMFSAASPFRTKHNRLKKPYEATCLKTLNLYMVKLYRFSRKLQTASMRVSIVTRTHLGLSP
jgi:hypothetical protein